MPRADRPYKKLIVFGKVQKIAHEYGFQVSKEIEEALTKQVVIIIKKAIKRCKLNRRKLVRVRDL